MTQQRLSVLSCNHFPKTAQQLLTPLMTEAHRLIQLTGACMTLPEDKLHQDSDASAATHQVTRQVGTSFCETLRDTLPTLTVICHFVPHAVSRVLPAAPLYQHHRALPRKPMPSAKWTAPWATSSRRHLKMMFQKN